MVAQAIARIIADMSLGPADRVTRAKALAGGVDVKSVAASSDLSTDDLVALAKMFANARSPIAIPGAVLAGQDKGTDATSMVQALNLIAGNLGQPGGLSLSQPSPHPSIVEPVMSTISNVQQLIGRMRASEVQALLVYGANPRYELPPKLGFADAVANVPFVVSFSPIVDETAVWSNLVIPDRTPLESWGYTFVSPNFGVPTVGSLQPVVMPRYDLRSTADILLRVAQSIPAAAQALPYSDEVAMLKDTIGKLPAGAPGGGVSPDALWARFQQFGGWWPATPTAPVALSPTAPTPLVMTPASFQGDEQTYPYVLNLYMSILIGGGQGAALPWLQGSPEPMTSISWQTWVQIHPDTAAMLGVDNGDLIRVTSPEGELEAPAYVYPGLRPDTVAIPVGQGHTDLGRYARDFGVNPMQLLGASAEASGASLKWSTVRVKLAATGKKMPVATFEYTPGIRQGFENKSWPGE